jgi:hypothetical protein
MSEKHCPTCRAVMDYMDHGFCSDCKKYCGCSFSPTSMSDYCHAHRPGGKPRPVEKRVTVVGFPEGAEL